MRKVEREFIVGFVEEARGYLPAVLQSLRDFQANPTRPQTLEEAHRLVHTIKGASSMVGLSALSHTAYHLEEAFDEIVAGKLVPDDEVFAVLFRTVARVGALLEGALSGGADEAAVLEEVVRDYRRLRGQPEGPPAEAPAPETAPALPDGPPCPDVPDPFGESAEPAPSVDIGLSFTCEPTAPPSPDFAEPPAAPAPSPEDAAFVVPPAGPVALDAPEPWPGAVDVAPPPDLPGGPAAEFAATAAAEAPPIPAPDFFSAPFDADAVDLSGPPGYPRAEPVADSAVDLGAAFPPGANSSSAPREEVSPELAEVFALEAEEHLRSMSAALPALQQQPGNKDLVQELRRSAHTLKGAAAMVGFRDITQLAHRMEDLLDQLYEGGRAVSAETVRLLFASTDALEDMAAGRSNAGRVAPLYAEYDQMLGRVGPAEARREGGVVVPELLATAVEAEEGAAAGTRAAGQYVRVPLERLDELVKLVGELVISRTAFEQRVSDLGRQMQELNPSIDRLRRVSYKLETQYEASALGGGAVNRLAAFHGHGFDDLEFDRYTEFHLLSRELAETTTDIQTVTGESGHLIGDFDGYLNREARLSGEIEDKLMRLRMVPLSTVASRLHRTVRNTASQCGKQAVLVLEGEGTELDKVVLEEMADPLMHLLRNAVDHGLEAPAARQARGKRPQGTVTLRAFQEGNQIVVQVSDDGGGIDPAAVRATAVKRGLLSEADAAAMTQQEMFSLVFLPGFSTARRVSEVSGRGVGLDVVRSQVHKLKGTLALESEPGRGAAFTVRLPMTLALTRALLVKAHGETFAVPLDTVRQIVKAEDDTVELVGQEPVLRLAGKFYPIRYLGKVLGLKQPADEVRRPPVLILNVGGQEVALAVDHLLGGREIVIKSLGSHLRRVRGVTGATLLGDGSVVLILNPGDLVTERGARGADRGARKPAPVSGAPSSEFRAPGSDEALTVLVVDDSPSVRRVVSNLIRGAGWQPLAAKDGLEALEVLHQAATPPDLVLLDVEMPRMDGYELLSTLRAQEAYQGLPIVMVTSRAGEKHRQKALNLGATGYVVKPYQDDALLETVRQCVARARQALRV